MEDCLHDVTVALDAHRNMPAEAAGMAEGSITDAKLRAAAVKSRHGSDKVPPGAETDAKVEAQFRTKPLAPDEASELQDALASARRGTRRILIGSVHASRSVARLRLASGPGPSGFRNSFIAVIHSHPDGPRALADWACVRAQATIAPWLAEL